MAQLTPNLIRGYFCRLSSFKLQFLSKHPSVKRALRSEVNKGILSFVFLQHDQPLAIGGGPLDQGGVDVTSESKGDNLSVNNSRFDHIVL